MTPKSTSSSFNTSPNGQSFATPPGSTSAGASSSAASSTPLHSPAAASGSHATAGAHGGAGNDILRAIEVASRNAAGGGRRPEPRTAARHCYCVPMTLHIDDPRGVGTRVIRAATSNISSGGFAFIFDAVISPGATIRAQFDSLAGKPQIAGIVRSCIHICGTQHRIGVEYQ